MARRLPKSPRIKRRKAVKKPDKFIVVVCEGRKTEPEYINQFVRDKKHPLVECKTINGVGVPKSIVDRAIAEKRLLIKNARKTGNSFDRNFEIWCVSDVDEHPGVREEMQRAADNGLKYALSNPCIELWGYLHYENQDAPIHRHDMQKKLSEVMPGYDHAQGARFNYDDMKERFDDAVKRAKELIRRREEEGDSNGVPSTTVYKLMESIEKIDKEGDLPSGSGE